MHVFRGRAAGKGKARGGPTLRVPGDNAPTVAGKCALHHLERVCGSHSRLVHRLRPPSASSLSAQPRHRQQPPVPLSGACSSRTHPLLTMERPAQRVGTEQHEIRRVVGAACQMLAVQGRQENEDAEVQQQSTANLVLERGRAAARGSTAWVYAQIELEHHHERAVEERETASTGPSQSRRLDPTPWPPRVGPIPRRSVVSRRGIHT